MPRHTLKRLSGLLAAWVFCLPGVTWSRAGGVVTVCDEPSLRAALEGGGLVTFACDGVIRLTRPIVVETDTVIEASGRGVALDGGGQVRVIEVEPGVSLRVMGLTVTGGQGVVGGGLLNAGGEVTLVGTWFIANRAEGVSGLSEADGTSGSGGAIQNEGTLAVLGGRFEANAAVGGAGGYGFQGGQGGDGLGAAIMNAGVASIANTLFRGNLAAGGAGGTNDWLNAFGDGGQGGAGGGGAGGGISNSGTIELRACTFDGNEARGGAGGPAAAGAYAGNGGDGGSGAGGGLHQGAGTVSVANLTFHANRALGGPGGDGGDALPVTGFGGHGGHGRNGFGGGIHVTGGTADVSSSTLAHNWAMPGLGGTGGVGEAGQDGPHAGDPGRAGIGWGGGLARSAGGLTVDRTIVAYATQGGNIGGTITDAGWNLSDDASFAFNATGSRSDTDPMLGPLADNGGSTPSLALLTGSPAVDAIVGGAVCAANDQRGVSRPQAAACDVGAFEGSVAFPGVEASFRPVATVVGQASELRFTLTNPNAWVLTGVGLTNVLGAGLRVAEPDAGGGLAGGVVVAPVGGQLIVLSGVTLAPNESLSFTIHVTSVSPGRQTSQVEVLMADQSGGLSQASDSVLEVHGAPVVTTGAASSAAPQELTLRAEIQPNGPPTQYYFEYGSTPEYGGTTPVVGLVGGMATLTVEQSLTGLGSGLSYHYRVVASNALGVVRGENQVGTTLGPALHALRLDGAGAYMASPDLAPHFLDDTISLELWFLAEGPGVLVEERGQLPPDRWWQRSLLVVGEDGEVMGQFNGLGSVRLGKATMGQWHHVALRYDRAAGVMEGMLDGVLSMPVAGDRAASQEAGRPYG